MGSGESKPVMPVDGADKVGRGFYMMCRQHSKSLTNCVHNKHNDAETLNFSELLHLHLRTAYIGQCDQYDHEFDHVRLKRRKNISETRKAW